MRAEPHPRQADRLRLLHSYDVLDTPREREFDEIVDLAARLCGTAISVVNLIDADRQWFKAEVGLGVRETPLETSICSHVVLERDFVEIPDTLADPRMSDNPLCLAEGGLRFYAGALLQTDEGLPLGTLCVLDHEPRRLNDLQRDALRVLARQVMAQLDLRRQLGVAEALRAEVDHRVKNSLSTIAAHVRLGARQVGRDGPAGELLADIGRRIDAVSLVHEHLYRAGGVGTVDLGAYLAQLREHLAMVAPDGIAVEAELPAGPCEVGAGLAGKAGMFVNEAVGNALKHAFPEEGADGMARGRVLVRLTSTGRDMVLAVSDDGAGMTGERPEGLGMTVLRASARALGGACEIEVGARGGTTVSVAFAAAGG
jgi:two-component sensor histidine kinase